MRYCLREPVPEILLAADVLREAVDRHKAGDEMGAAKAFAKANCSIVREWTESIWGKGWQETIQLRTVPSAPPALPKEARVPVRMPTMAERLELVARDGYHCRYCGIPVVPERVRKAAIRLYPDVVPWPRHNLGQHAGFQAMWLQFDHVLAHARGGDNSFDNIVISCAPCNFGKANYTLDELGLVDPRTRPVAKWGWNGLIDFLA